MRRWLAMTAGLLIWAVHFLGLYLLSSAADVWATAEAPAARGIGLGFSLICIASIALLAVALVRRDDQDQAAAWERRVALTGALVAGIAVAWQTAPLAL